MEVMQHTAGFLLPKIPSEKCASLNYALVILNQRLPRFAPLLWNHSRIRVCADGGANRLFDEMPLFFPEIDARDVRQRYKPDVIKGDMDSIRDDVLDYYSKQGCNTIDESQDQDTTDLHKCIAHISNLTPDSEKSNLCILVTGALGGRFDHEAGNINVLYRFSGLRIILLSDDCLIQVLPKTHHHKIHIQSSIVGPHCGLIPIGMTAACSTTSGLKWNLNGTEMKFGGLVSTSNLVTGDAVTVQSDADLVWTISIKSDSN
ncbi:hypothetical protein RND81_05G204400 [Saponaria officinalis]|uniref:Thiamine pyrophosphokinase n=2 Tax=Saponaria officinalis TaxID=3572 RepID=A0AAW1KUE3_SAPOF